MPAHKIRGMVCSDHHELVQKTGSVYFEENKPKTTKTTTNPNILNKFKQTRKSNRKVSKMQGNSYS